MCLQVDAKVRPPIVSHGASSVSHGARAQMRKGEKAEVCKTSELAQPTENLLQVIPLLGK
jgi:hypothetical protein